MTDIHTYVYNSLSLSMSLSLYIYIYIYTTHILTCIHMCMNVSCFRAGGVHSVQTSVNRIPHTRSQFGPGVRDQLPRVLS